MTTQDAHHHRSLQAIGAGGLRGLALLLEAHDFAEELMRSAWDFALEIDMIEAAGLNRNKLRWLVCQGYVAYGRELPDPTDGVRQFCNDTTLAFDDKTCFVLTPQGVALARRLGETSNGEATDADGEHASNGHAHVDASASTEIDRPTWDPHRRELRVGAAVVKQFKLPSPNQEMILVVFEEEGWPTRIDDPLLPHPEVDPKRRLHDTIKSLNRNQKRRLVRFMGDGSGQGILWEFINDAPSAKRPAAAVKSAEKAPAPPWPASVKAVGSRQ